jgi:hypothetical protein
LSARPRRPATGPASARTHAKPARAKPVSSARAAGGRSAESTRAMLNDIRVRGEQLTSDIKDLLHRLA